MIGHRVGDNDQTWLSEAGLRVIGKGTRAESAVDAAGANKLGKLDNGSLTNVFAADNANVLGVVDGGDDARSEHNLFPHLLDVENVGTALATLENVLLHLVLAVGVAQVHFGGQNFAGVIAFEFEDIVAARHDGFFFGFFLEFFDSTWE